LMVRKELQIDGIAERRDAECAEDGNSRKDGREIAMAGWGHLRLPFCAAAKWRCAPVLPWTCGGGELRRVGPLQRTVRHDAAGRPTKIPAGRLEARELEREYQCGRS
jgi:hypothetical protein